MTSSPSPKASTAETTDSHSGTNEGFTGATAARCGIGGVFMGLANLVPGISGGTMLLAAGVYPRFIQAVADLSALRFSKNAILTIACIAGCAVAAIVGLAGLVKDLVIDHRWVMYSLFIGLTLGGVPVVWKLITQNGKRADSRVWIGATLGLIGMAALAVFQMQQTGGAENAGIIMMLLAGIAGASAMILPGVSGGYLLLVLGVYVPILSAIDAFKEALKAGDLAAMLSPGLQVVLPVGVGVLVGVAGVSNGLKWALARYERQTLGVLIGLLVGAVVGLWPYQAPKAPQNGDLIKGQTVIWTQSTETDLNTPNALSLTFSKTGELVDTEDWPTAFFRPTGPHIGGALGLIVLGFGATFLIAKFGDTKPKKTA